MKEDEPLLGAYGVAVAGLDIADGLIGPAAPGWPLVTVAQHRVEEALPVVEEFGEDRAVLRLGGPGGGWVEYERRSRTGTFFVSGYLGADQLVHPYLASVGAVFARWHGWEPFHAGALVVDGGAWGVVGDREAGKSSLLAWMAKHGHQVLTDDLLVVAGTTAFAGPRCLDLRPPTVNFLEMGKKVMSVRSGERGRLTLPPVAAQVPLRGWVLLAWGPEVEVVRIPPSLRLGRLGPHRAVRLAPTDPAALLPLVSLPVFELRRPPRWELLPAVASRLLDVLRG